MTRGGERPLLTAALVLLAAAGIALHLRAHPVRFAPAPDVLALAAAALSLADLLLVTALFLFRRTAVYGYLLNGFLVIYGSVLMGHQGLAGIPSGGVAAVEQLAFTTLPDLAVAWADFLLGAALFKSWTGPRS